MSSLLLFQMWQYCIERDICQTENRCFVSIVNTRRRVQCNKVGIHVKAHRTYYIRQCCSWNVMYMAQSASTWPTPSLHYIEYVKHFEWIFNQLFTGAWKDNHMYCHATPGSSVPNVTYERFSKTWTLRSKLSTQLCYFKDTLTITKFKALYIEWFFFFMK